MREMTDFIQPLWSYILSFLNTFIPDYILPNIRLILQIILILIIGFLVGRLSKAVTVKILTIAGIKKITVRGWTDDILRAVGYKGTFTGLIGDLVKWFVYILFIGSAIQIAGFPGLSEIFNQIAIFVPRFIAAILIIVIGFLIADFFGKVFEEAARRIVEEEILSSLIGGVAKYSVALITLIISLALIGIDTFSLTMVLVIILGTAVIVLVMGIKEMFPNLTAGLYLKKILRIGEYIRVEKYAGKIERIEPLHIVLISGGKTISIPNSFLLTHPIERKQ